MSKKSAKNDDENKQTTKSYYNVLGLESKCTKDDINAAYRSLAMKWHPDKNKNKDIAEKKFTEITKAYQILSNEESRKNYDSYGITSASDGNANIFDPYEIYKNIFDTNDNDIPNVIVSLETDINKLHKGFTTVSVFNRLSPCDDCDSNGTRSKNKEDCAVCKGRGILLEKIKGGKVGFIFMENTCGNCGGNGIDPAVKLCKSCNGRKYIKEELECDVDIPKGAYDGYFIKLENEGNYIPPEDRKSDKDRSDVLVVIKENISPNVPIRRGLFIHELNRLNRADLLMTVDITFAESIVGIKKEIPVLAGEKLGIEIDDIIQNEDTYVVKGMGMYLVPEEITKHKLKNNTRGDLFLRFKVEKPILSKAQQKRLWQIITNTSYPIYDDIENVHSVINLKDYISELKSDNVQSKIRNNKSKSDSRPQTSNIDNHNLSQESDSEIEDVNTIIEEDNFEEEINDVIKDKNPNDKNFHTKNKSK